MWNSLLIIAYSWLPIIHALDNGLALTPPMGWLSWERFECNTNCREDPDNCIGERLVMQMADRMAQDGFLAAGYEYIALDDCWPARDRDPKGNILPDPERFPHGMKALADYVHSLGLKLGLYADVGRHTCAGFPGSLDHYEQDSNTFAEWGVDMVKFDGCNTDEQHFEIGYPLFGFYLNKTRRPIMYSCEWALYARAKGFKANYTAVAETCNTFRVYGDIWDNYESIQSISKWYADDEGNFSAVAAPGSFNDADMLVIGNYGLSKDGAKSQMGFWAMVASPLLMSVDLRTIDTFSKELLQNKRVLKINQDPLGVQGKAIIQFLDGNLQVWTRPLSARGSFAIAIVYLLQVGQPLRTSFSLKQLGLTHQRGYNFTEVFDGGHFGSFKPNENITSFVNPSGIVLLTAEPLN
ncbi:hypothetical protein CAPTEDRAFT_183492 [Capitella teleta]|uniref:Alpha-galactosidase n=1 Tax=Capitella teleta TaxID=283909 RepID=R7TSD7_CAPTE|nr:hypothetical protein CAPTEDRAFT_183492 [Capitella teleta]|eukprot:ELT96522.1 hypothetical protein CAPTEDRAFT_183492 [Capitella teleta]